MHTLYNISHILNRQAGQIAIRSDKYLYRFSEKLHSILDRAQQNDIRRS